MEIVCLTRFNLEIPSFCEDGERLCLNEEYLNSRFDIFEKYTLPSMMAQTEDIFSWIIMFHKDTPLKFRKKIDSYVASCPQIIPWYLSAEEGIGYVAITSDYLKETYPNQKVITIRLDNDDVLNRDFLKRTKEFFLYNDVVKVYSTENGLQYDTEHHRVLRYRYPCNHFLSMYERTDAKDNNILCFDHSLIRDYFSQEQLRIEDNHIPMWVEIISGTNVVNAMYWSFSGLKLPTDLADSFPMLSFPWKRKAGKTIYVLSLVPRVLFSKIATIIKKIQRKLFSKKV